MAGNMKVAIAGASGIGRHHAKWYNMLGCEVVGFWGRSEESCRATEKVLGDLFGFRGKGYQDLEQLLEREKPDLVDVCTPNELHYECALRSLEAGCHVLCEKPVVWQDEQQPEILLEKGRNLVESAQSRDLRFGVCTQYAASLPHYLKLYESACGKLKKIASFYAEMESMGGDRRRSASEMWIDMAPHPLSLILKWMPTGAIVRESLQVAFKGGEARCTFGFAHGREVCRCEVIVRDVSAGDSVRRFGVNDFIVDIAGRTGIDGIYQTVLAHGDREVWGDDLMYLLIAQFVESIKDPRITPLATGKIGLRNLELQQQVMQFAFSQNRDGRDG